MTLATDMSTPSSHRDGQTVGVPCVSPKAALTPLETPPNQALLQSLGCSFRAVPAPLSLYAETPLSVSTEGTCFQSLSSLYGPSLAQLQLSWRFPIPPDLSPQPGVSPSAISRCSFFPPFHSPKGCFSPAASLQRAQLDMSLIRAEQER